MEFHCEGRANWRFAACSYDRPMGRAVDILFCADETMAMPLGVALYSVAKHVTAREVRFYVGSVGLSDDSRARIRRVARPFELEIIDLESGSLLPRNLAVTERFSRAAYARLVVGELFPDKDRVLYLDSDLVCFEDPASLFDTELNGHAVGAVRDEFMPRVGSDNCVGYAVDELDDPDAAAFNSGVMLIDLDRWRSQEVSRRALDFIERHGDRLNWADQDALNVVLNGRWHEFDGRWNQQVSGRWSQPGGQVRMNRDGISHFVGANKPWATGLRHRLRRDYESQLRASGWFSPGEFLCWRVGRVGSEAVRQIGKIGRGAKTS
ncbi:MAG: glycosyltransferase family 8 protein [Planctomycetota bacterium]